MSAHSITPANLRVASSNQFTYAFPFANEHRRTSQASRTALRHERVLLSFAGHSASRVALLSSGSADTRAVYSAKLMRSVRTYIAVLVVCCSCSQTAWGQGEAHAAACLRWVPVFRPVLELKESMQHVASAVVTRRAGCRYNKASDSPHLGAARCRAAQRERRASRARPGRPERERSAAHTRGSALGKAWPARPY
jgi:hypothetical protein